MATYLLAWNPKNWPWAKIAKDGDSWRTSNRKIQVEDHIFLVKVGKPPRGIFAQGKANGAPRLETHSEVDAKKRWYVPISLSQIINPDTDPILLHSKLTQISSRVRWTPQASGIRIPDEIENSLMSAWLEHLANPLSDIRKISADTSLSKTDRETLTKARIGQGQFREDLLGYWEYSCAVTSVKNPNILRASHIKPWRSSKNTERRDPYNGLLLIPNLDQAFDRYLISFSDDGNILVSSRLSVEDRLRLGIADSLKLRRVTKQHMEYLTHHRQIFLSCSDNPASQPRMP